MPLSDDYRPSPSGQPTHSGFPLRRGTRKFGQSRSAVSCLVLISAASALAQGVVDFNKDVFPLPDGQNPDRLVYLDYGAGIKLTGTQFKAELYYQDQTGSFLPIPVSISTFRSPDTPLPGTWAGVSQLALPIGGVGVPVWLQVRVWDGTTSATFEQAQTRTGTTDPGSSLPPYTDVVWIMRIK